MFIIKIMPRDRKMPPWIKVFGTKPDNLSSIYGIHMMERSNY